MFGGGVVGDGCGVEALHLNSREDVSELGGEFGERDDIVSVIAVVCADAVG